MAAGSQVVKVGLADMKIAKAPDTIRTSGLGSCVGVVLYDLTKKVCGMAHIMLPDSSLARGATVHPAKFADTAIPGLIRMLEKEGCRKDQLRAKIAGGAQMFKFSSSSEIMRIGPRNVEAVTHWLKKFSIPVTGQETGGSSGRTIEFDPDTGKLFIRTVNLGEKVI